MQSVMVVYLAVYKNFTLRIWYGPFPHKGSFRVPFAEGGVLRKGKPVSISPRHDVVFALSGGVLLWSSRVRSVEWRRSDGGDCAQADDVLGVLSR